MNMYETTDTSEWDEFDREHVVDWAASCRLALVVSILAAVAAFIFSALVGETALVVCVIVAASAISWFHLEHGQLSRPLTRPLPVRRD